MPLTYENCEAVILAGGRSKRMGSCKALLPKQGRPLIHHIYDQLSAFDSCCLSANDPTLDDCLEIPVIRDVYEDCGPLGGIHATLKYTKKDAVFVVPCDLPFFCTEVPNRMLREIPEDADAMVCMDSTGRVHPLCGIYRCNILDRLEAYLWEGGRRVIPFLERLNCSYFQVGQYLSEAVLYNMNTPEDYRMVQAYSAEDGKQLEQGVKHFKSRRNIVTLMESGAGKVVRKRYLQQEACLWERMVYEKLEGSVLPHAQILQSSLLEITITYLPGRTLLELLETQESTGEICRTVWDKLVQWLMDFHTVTGLTMTDVNLRNFLYDETRQTLYGMDFEECGAGEMVVTAARTAAYIRNYAPERTPIKMEIADYVLRQFSSYLNMDMNELRMEAEKQERILLMRRKNRT